MKNRLKFASLIILLVVIFSIGFSLNKTTPDIILEEETSSTNVPEELEQSKKIAYSKKVTPNIILEEDTNSTLKEFEQTEEMDKLQEYLINSTKNSNRAYVTLPSSYMQVLRNYLKTHKSTGGLPSVGLSFTGVQFWVYDTISIFLHDNDTMVINIDNVSFDLTNDPHVCTEGPFFETTNVASSKMWYQPSRDAQISKGWCLEEDTLSYWHFGKKLAQYDLPQTEILDFSTNRFESSSGDVVTKTATIVTQNEIILASKECLQTIPMEDMFHYYFTNNGYIFYVTNAHDLYQVDIQTGEAQLKKSNVSCIIEFKGWGDGGHNEFTYVTTDGTTHTGMVAM